MDTLREEIRQMLDQMRSPVEATVCAEPDLERCPNCGGPADNGFDRCYPPNAYFCSRCLRA